MLIHHLVLCADQNLFHALIVVLDIRESSLRSIVHQRTQSELQKTLNSKNANVRYNALYLQALWYKDEKSKQWWDRFLFDINIKVRILASQIICSLAFETNDSTLIEWVLPLTLDASSFRVRVAVLKELIIVSRILWSASWQGIFSTRILKLIVDYLRQIFYDTSEKVRYCFALLVYRTKSFPLEWVLHSMCFEKSKRIIQIYCFLLEETKPTVCLCLVC